MEKKSYHDYVIKDGKFIGDFENLYRDHQDPWTQSTQPNKYGRTAGIIHMKEFNIQSIVECGCGLGYYADWIHKETNIIPKSIDISEVAIERAKSLFPDLDFSVSDITTELNSYKDYDCILLSEIIWYILPSLDSIIEELKANFKGKYLMINQVFYKGTQKYGTEYFTSMKELIEYVPFELIANCEATTVNDTTIETSVLFKI